MSNRRKPRAQRRTKQARPTPTALERYDALKPWLWAMQDADEAECRGDASGALAIINRRLTGPDGEVFWRASRLRWLEQVVMLEPEVPGWVRSRWILAQALQHIDETDYGAAVRRRRAVSVAAEIRGGLHRVRGADADDRRVQVMDHDWVFRQVLLYELDGLERFLWTGAAPDLIAGSDHVEDWVHAPMGGFRFVCSLGDRLMWVVASSDPDIRTVMTPNIGTAVSLRPGDHVLGRLVPVAGGSMFDGPVLAVPRDVARDVETDPARWLDVLRGAKDDVRAGRIDPHLGAWRGLVSDIPCEVVDVMLDPGDDVDFERAGALSAAVRARAAVEMAGAFRTREIVREALRDHGEDVSAFDDDEDLVAVMHGALSDPAIVAALPEVVGPDDVRVLEDLCDRLAEPARTIVGSALAARDAAA